MESHVVSSPKNQNHPSPKQLGNEGVTIVRHLNGSIRYQKHSYKTAYDNLQHEKLPNVGKRYYDPSKGKYELVGKNEVFISSQMQALTVEGKSSFKQPIYDHKNLNLCGPLENERIVQLNNDIGSLLGPNFFPSPLNSMCTGTSYIEAKQSFTDMKVSECAEEIKKKKYAEKIKIEERKKEKMKKMKTKK